LNDNVFFMLGASEYYREDFSFVNAIIHNSRVESDFFAASKVDRFIDQVKEKALKGAIT